VTSEFPISSARASTSPVRRGHLRQLTRRDRVVLGIMIGVPTLIQLVLVWIPTLASIVLSFFKWDGLQLGGFHFNGLTNYNFVFNQAPQFWPAVLHNFVWLLFLAVIGTPLGLLLAVLLDSRIRGSRIYQTVFFMPVMLSLALIGIIWEFVYSQNYGLINTVIGRNSNANAIDWLGNPHLNLWAVMLEASWRQAGYVMVLYLAGLKAVDPTLREAALVDGSSAWQTFWRVIFPVMKPINIVVLVVTVIESLRAFDLVYITNKGINGLELLSVLVTSNIVGETQRIGYGSAIGVVLLVISLVPITIFLYQTFRREETS
jgi:ABC-type sugar transport system permease subunit